MNYAAFTGVALTLTAGAPAVAHAKPPPPAVVEMIDAAAATGKPETLKTIADLARQTYPESRAEIDAQVAALTAKAERTKADRLARQTLLQSVTGEAQVGFSNSSGDSTTINLALGVKLAAQTRRWKHTLTLEATFERENGVTSSENERVAYQARYMLSRRLYALGALNWDRDPFDGYTSRGSLGVGLGYVIVERPNLTLSADLAPAVRRIDFVAANGTPASTETAGAVRVGSALAWTIAPKLVFSEDLLAFVQSDDNTIISLTSLTGTIWGSLSGRLSFRFEHDSRLPPGFDNTETLTRATLVYGFK